MSKKTVFTEGFLTKIAVVFVGLAVPLMVFAWASTKFEQRLDNQGRTLRQLAVVLTEKVPNAIAHGINRGRKETQRIARKEARKEALRVVKKHLDGVQVLGAFSGRPCFGRGVTIRDNSPVFFGTAGNDVIRSGRGDQSVFALGGNDRVCAGRGNDTLDAQHPLNASSDYDRTDGGRGRDECDAELRKRCER